MLTESFDVFIQDFGVPCVCGGIGFQALFDLPDEMFSMGGGNVQSSQYVLTAKSRDVLDAAIVVGSTVTVSQNGADSDYKVRFISRIEDGAFAHVGLSKI